MSAPLEQRYEVRAKDGQGREFVVGRTNHADGGRPMHQAMQHPLWRRSARVVDLHKEGTPA